MKTLDRVAGRLLRKYTPGPWRSKASRPLDDPMMPLPTRADDPKLEGWYHTIELAPGIIPRNAEFDHREIVHRVDLPASLAGKTALDVGTADGFWAFEMERRGAKRVVATDIVMWGDHDCLPVQRAQHPEWSTIKNPCTKRFATAHAMLGSRVEHRGLSIYDLSPETVGTFDVVYCGSLLLHLFNPLQAIINIRSVTREMAIIETVRVPQTGSPVEQTPPDQPYALFGVREWESTPGERITYWRISTRALCDMLTYAGFATTEPQGEFIISGPKGNSLPVTSVVARVAA